MYPSMKRWVDYCERNAGASLIYPGGRFGDWFDFSVANGNKESATAKDLVGTAYLAYSAYLTAEAAKVLDKEADACQYDSLYNKVKASFKRKYIVEDTEGDKQDIRLSSDTQTARVYPCVGDTHPL